MKLWSKQDLHITRAIGEIDGAMSSSELLDRMEANGCPRPTGHTMVARAVKVGLLLREGKHAAYSYRLNTAYVAPERKPTRVMTRHTCTACGRPMRAPAKALPDTEKKPPHEIRPPHNGITIVPTPGTYAGPVFDRSPLVQHLGTPCGDDDELTPAEGERYRDTTRRIFRKAFTE